VPKYHAITCKTCEKPIKIGKPLEPGEEEKVLVPGLEPIPCEYGSSYHYGSDDVFVLEEET
jgi:hypothetical protein